MNRDIGALVESMTVDERASLTAGASAWSTAAVPRVGIPEVFVSDGPAGARGPQIPGAGEQVATLNIPCGAALGATWNTDLLGRLGEALGDQTRTKACRVLLAPTVNLHRAPLAGRNFESYSEDPFLTGKLAAAFIRGVQSQGVATTVKHYAGNEAEFERMTIDSVIDERTLRELYLLPFELAVREGGSLGIMTSYNRLNGLYNSENHELLQTILRDEWGFEGFVVTDWFAGGSTGGAAAAGLDLEMPGPSRFYGRRLGQAVRDGDVDEVLLDGAVHRLLTVFDRIGALDDEPRAPIGIDRPEHRALVRAAAAESMVLLKNDADGGRSVLPLDPAQIATLAVIGPNAERARITGGGSAEVRPHYRISPLDAIRERLGASVTIVHEPGCDIDKSVPVISADQLDNGTGEPGFVLELYRGSDFAGEIVSRRVMAGGRLLLLPGVEPDVPSGPICYRATSRLIPTQSGPHLLSLLQLGSARVFVDGAVVFDGIAEPTPRGEAYFGTAKQELVATVELAAGVAAVIDVEFISTQRGWMQGVQLGCKAVPSSDQMERAVAAAAGADAAIVIVGTNNDWETEGHDRASMDLPGAQAELIERVSRANPNTVVVVNAGAPITTGWAGEVPAVLQVWFGGQEMSNALVDVLFGDAEPSGRLPTTFPSCIEHTPSFGNFPGEHGQIRYGEGVLMGYRWYEARKLAVPFAFGHGLSYTTFAIGPPHVDATFDPNGGGTLDVHVSVANTGSRRGAEVVQLYVGATTPAVVRPPKELKAFAKVWLDPGETATVTLTLDARSFSYWDPGNRYKGALAPTAVGFFGTTPDATAGWRADPGMYRIHVGRASNDIAHTVELQLVTAPTGATP
ncbi:MAG: glycoside hydrolase, family 3 domain protein [Ilumatobacteraceae bacterium]|nr:glycoside hydrolase, family 3 domain protein [Ilumatobacteraceae bacterium]